MIIAISNLKGGVGKTTSALHLAACMYSNQEKVTVIDADSEKSALEWAGSNALAFDVVEGNRDGLARQARKYAVDGHVVIDGPPNSRDVLWSAAAVADRVIVPVAPTGLDVNRLRSTLEVLLDIEASRGDLDTRILFTRWDSRKILAREAEELLKDFPVLKNKIRALTRYEKAFGGMPDYLIEYDKVLEELKNGA